MYYEYFGLKRPPFKITPNTNLFYEGGKRGLILDALVYAIKQGEGIIKVVGEVGSGKTMLCRMLETRLPKYIEIVYLANPRLSPDMVLHAIALEMQLPITPDSNRLQVMQALHTALLEKHAYNQQVVVFIEEAQSMALDTLEEIRLLSNLETAHNKLLQIVLFGQPELDNNLSAIHIRQLKERITHSFYLTPLTRREIGYYLDFRMRAMGYRGPPIFSKQALRVLTHVSKGLIRRINILADKSLLAAFAENTHQVRAKHICLAARDSGLNCYSFWLPIYLALGTLGIIFLLTLGSWWFSYQQAIQANLTTDSTSPRTTVAATSPAPADTLLQHRLQVTEQWLTQVDQHHYSIQVMQTPTSKTHDLTRFLQGASIQPLLENLYIYQTKVGERLLWRVMYGEFTDRQKANTAMAALPPLLRRNRPLLRQIKQLYSR
jgi:type II secretory pathway predicted ATPase ExeA